MEEQFQTRLFGYSKQSVHNYIVQMNEDFSQKQLAKEKENRDAVQALQEELERLRKENALLRAERREVAGALIDAKSFAANLMEQAKEEDRAQRAENTSIHQAERQRLRALAGHIGRLQEDFRRVLHDMDKELERYDLRCRTIQAEDAKAAPSDQPEEDGETVPPVQDHGPQSAQSPASYA